MKIIYKQCPRWESKDTLKIIYGMPKRDLWETEDYWLGGCCVEIDEEAIIILRAGRNLFRFWKIYFLFLLKDFKYQFMIGK